MTVCRCCGQTLPQADFHHVPLSPVERKVADAVLAAGEHGIAHDALREAIYGKKKLSPGILRVTINHANAKLRLVGREIVTPHRGWGTPYIYRKMRVDHTA